MSIRLYFFAVGNAVALGAALMWVTISHTHPPTCGATGPLVAVLREVDPDVACTLTGTIMNARIELVERE